MNRFTVSPTVVPSQLHKIHTLVLGVHSPHIMTLQDPSASQVSDSAALLVNECRTMETEAGTLTANQQFASPPLAAESTEDDKDDTWPRTVAPMAKILLKGAGVKEAEAASASESLGQFVCKHFQATRFDIRNAWKSHAQTEEDTLKLIHVWQGFRQFDPNQLPPTLALTYSVTDSTKVDQHALVNRATNVDWMIWDVDATWYSDEKAWSLTTTSQIPLAVEEDSGFRRGRTLSSCSEISGGSEVPSTDKDGADSVKSLDSVETEFTDDPATAKGRCWAS